MVIDSDRQRRITTASPLSTRTPHSAACRTMAGRSGHQAAVPPQDSQGSGRGRACCRPATSRAGPGHRAFLCPRSPAAPVRPFPVRAFPPFPLLFPRPRNARRGRFRRVLPAGNITCSCSPACSPVRNSPDPDLVPMARRTPGRSRCPPSVRSGLTARGAGATARAAGLWRRSCPGRHGPHGRDADPAQRGDSRVHLAECPQPADRLARSGVVPGRCVLRGVQDLLCLGPGRLADPARPVRRLEVSGQGRFHPPLP
jgi:hypothetical protein